MTETIEIVDQGTITVIETVVETVNVIEGETVEAAVTETIQVIDESPQTIEVVGMGPQGPPGSGDVSGANVGSGAGVFKEKASNTLYFRSLKDAGNSLFTITQGTDEVTFDIPSGALTNSLLADMAQNTIKGRISSGAGAPEDLTAAQTRSLINVEDGAAADQVASEVPFTPVRGISATNVQTAIEELDLEKSDVGHTHDTSGIDDDSITNAKLAEHASYRIKGRISVGTGNPEDLTAAQVRTIINVENNSAADQVASEVPFTPTGGISSGNVQAALAELDSEKAASGHTHSAFSQDTDGFVPGPTAAEISANKYLRADGTWENPPSGSGGEANEGANVGTGVGIYKNKVGVVLNFRSLADAGSGRISIAQDGDAVDFDIPASILANDRLVDIAQDRIKGRISAGSGVLEDLTAAQVRTIINVEDGAKDDQDASEVPFTPDDLSDWNAGVDPGEVDDALDQLAANLAPLLPPAAPVLDQIDWDSSDGPTGANTWNNANPISGYISAATAGSVNNSSDNVDIQMGTSGNEHGVTDHDSPGNKDGTLNEDVTATDNYPEDCFGPGGSDGGGTNDLKILLNGSILHTVDLLSFGSGDSVNGNGSGFIGLSVATPVYFADSTPFPARTYRTGSWRLGAADVVKGYNVIKLQHVTAAGTQETNVHEFLADDVDTATAFSGETLGTLAMTGSKHLSGVEYHTGGTAKYSITISNAYRNTYDDTDAVTFTETNLNNLSNEDLAASGGDEGKQHVITNKTCTVSTGRKINSLIRVITNVNRTVQSDLSSSGGTITGLLVDPTNPTSTALNDYMDDEDYRIHGGSDFNTNLSSNWDETQSLVGASADYNDGLQVTEGRLYYPGGASISDYDTAQAPSGNPDYGSASGVRHYWRLFTNGVATSNFRVQLVGDFTLISDATTFSGGANNQVKVALRWPTQTGWLDLNVEFNEGDFGSTSEAARFGKDNGDSLTDGCHSTTLDVGAAKGVTIGTKTTADSYDKFYLRIITSPNFNGYIDAIYVTWNAS
jgi:hypothetical protein